MKHFSLKFNHGVEIGAMRAYMGHFKRTNDLKIRAIAQDEYEHQLALKSVLKDYGEVPSPIIDSIFWFIGTTVALLCSFSPLFMLNFVARTMETFAIFNYNRLAKKYPEYSYIFNIMASTEEEHQFYFKEII